MFRLLHLGVLIACLVSAAFAAPDYSQPYRFTVWAGDIGLGTTDGSGASARFTNPSGLALDAAGNVYVADTQNHTIRRISASGAVTTLAGKAREWGAKDATGAAARFNSPSSVAVDAKGNIFVADTNNHAIRKITPSGVVSTVAGQLGVSGFANGNGTKAKFLRPTDVAVTASGVLYVADSGNKVVRRISEAGAVTTYAGLAGADSGNTDGIGEAARFVEPYGVCVDANGVVFVADRLGSSIRKIATDRMVTTLVDTTGLSEVAFSPKAIAVDQTGALYVAGGSTIRRFSSSGESTLFAGIADTPGNLDGPAASATFSSPAGVAVSSAGVVYVANNGTHTVRRISADGTVSTIAGIVSAGSTDGARTTARFRAPSGIARDAAGNFFMTDTGNHTVRKISAAGVVSTFAGAPGESGMVDGSADVARFSAPAGIAVDEADTLYVVDTRNYVIRKITAKGVVSTLAGTPGVQGTSDGKKGVGKFWAPTGVTFWKGALYVTDSGWSTLRKVSLTGEITTVAGGEFPTGMSQDGTGRFAQFSNPLGLTVDGAGRLVIADNWSGLIRRVNSSYEVTTILGQAYSFVVDDGEGTAARFVSPTALATDTSGNVLVVQSVMPSVRRFDSKLVSRTLAGGFANLPSESGTGGFASFGDLTGVSAAPDGAVYVVDSTLNAIWKGVSVPNTAPKISKFVDKTIKEDKSLPPVPFTVSDAETPSYDLTVSATSSNTKLLASSAITLTQTAGAWQLTATPKPNTNGKTTVSVTVTDGGASSTEKFVLKVKAVNDPPVLGEIGSFVIAAGDTSETRSFTVSIRTEIS
ncbi:MAG: hypothetical protein NVV63_14475 [Opitutus sp.]|nr:hypothetical protein [Opitutus sp.]